MKKGLRRDGSLTELPGIGVSVAGDLRRIGVKRAADLRGRDPFALYAAICEHDGVRHDPCLIDALIAAVRYVDGAPPRPWWRFTAERKRALAARRPALLFALLIGLALAACRTNREPARSPGQPAQEVTVTVSMYSGRQDPSFVLDDPAEIEALATMLRDSSPAPEFDGESVLRSILGYRGVLVHNASGVEGLPDDLIVFGGFIEARGEERHFLHDEGQRIEGRLIELALASKAISEAELRIIRER